MERGLDYWDGVFPGYFLGVARFENEEDNQPRAFADEIVERESGIRESRGQGENRQGEH